MSVTNKQIIKTWWPLAASWLLMGFESPLISAILARLQGAEINLAAYGGIIMPLSFIIEAPIIMLLSASTALCKDMPSYRKIFKFMMITSFALTVLHILIAFTPLYYLVVRNIIGSPEAIIEPARIGLMIMTPWTWAIGYRRFQQGVMIRYNNSQAVWVGTIVRLVTLSVILMIGYSIGTIQGVAVGTTAQALAVIAEAVYNGFRVRPVIRKYLVNAPEVEPLTWKAFFNFYIPLVMTSFITLIWQPIGSAALSRMPRAVESLAVWQVMSGLMFIFRSPGTALNEVVVAMIEKQGAFRRLQRFAVWLGVISTAVQLVFIVSPLSFLWFKNVSAITPALIALAQSAFWFAVPLPALSVLQSWYQGSILASKKTRSITESVTIFLAVIILVLFGGVAWGKTTGLYFGIAGMVLGVGAQVLWLFLRSRNYMRLAAARDSEPELATA